MLNLVHGCLGLQPPSVETPSLETPETPSLEIPSLETPSDAPHVDTVADKKVLVCCTRTRIAAFVVAVVLVV